MKIQNVKIKNFRSYKDEVSIAIGDLTTFVGKNDIGKSSVLEALDIFFNDGKGAIKLDKDDINKQSQVDGINEISITVCFDELPDSIIIDSSNETDLKSEYLLNSNNHLEILKTYPNAGKEKVFIKAFHPSKPECNDLLRKRDSELRSILNDNNIECSDKNKNATMRSAIWHHFRDDLQMTETLIDVTKGETKSIWDKLQNYLPIYSLFQSDRKNSDGDNEVQDPLKEAVRQILRDADLKKQLKAVATVVETKLKEVSSRTLDKLREMNPDIANSLNPIIPDSESLKWSDVFKTVSITGDEEIPINKRGSGVKRLILLNFFRAEAERRKKEKTIPSIVYAIEEPETSQHTEHQKKLVKAFLSLSKTPQTQIILTTHSAPLVKELNFSHLRLISQENGLKTIETVIPGQLPYPSLNEVNFLAFSEVNEEYHNELYGYIEAIGEMENFRDGKPTMMYNKIQRNGNIRSEQIILTDYIRHQIHHPENTSNIRYTLPQLKESTVLMRAFIQSRNQ